NDIIFGKDDYLFEAFTLDEERASQHVEAVNAFGRQLQSENVALMLVPSSLSIYPEKVPPYVGGSGEREAIDWIYDQLDGRIASLSLLEILLKKKDETIYFRTDHHWTTLGAYEGYVQSVEAVSMEPLDRQLSERVLVSESVYSSYYARANDFSVRADVMEYLHPADERDVLVTYDDGSKRDSLVFEEAIGSS